MNFLFVPAVLACLTVAIFFMQHGMIYFPRQYAFPSVPAGVQALEFETGQGRQVCFYVPPTSAGEAVPKRLWLVWGGNASLALDWLDFVRGFPDSEAGFLLVEYPGYGKSSGRAGPHSIQEVSEKALGVLAEHLAESRQMLEARLHLLGHSLGAAASLQFAVRHDVQRIVLVAPFTSLRDMAVRVVGYPLNYLTLHRYDNRARLRELAATHPDRKIFILHGDRDEIVPVKMGRELAGMFPKMISYREIPGGDHNAILGMAEQEIFAAMLGDQAESWSESRTPNDS